MSSMIDELEQLSTLHEMGALTDEQFAAAKRRVLSDGPEEDSGEEQELALVKAEQLRELGNLEYMQGNLDKALRCYQGALDIAQVVGNKHSEAINLGGLATAYYSQGQYERAIEIHTQAIDIARDIGNRHSEGVNLGNLAHVYQTQGQYERAIGLYTQALDIDRELCNNRSEGTSLGNLGDTLFRLGHLDEAESAFRQAIPITDETFPVAAGAFRGSLAWLLAQQDQLVEAQSMLETGEAQVEPYPEEHAKFLTKKGQVCHLAGDADGARASLEQAQALAADLKVGDESEVSQAIRELEAVLSGG